MRVDRGKAAVISDLIIDEDVDFLTLYKLLRLAAPASGGALRKGNKDIANAEVADAAAIAESKLSLNYATHTKYTDAEAKTQAEGAKLDDHAVPDDNTDLDASTNKHGLFAKLLWDKLDGIEAGATIDLTGAEIVTLLEALAGAAQLSHDQLSDVSTSDHHVKYTDGSAVSAMGAKGDANPLNHDRVTDAAINTLIDARVKASDYQILFPILSEEAPQSWTFSHASWLKKLAHSIKHPEAISIKQIGLLVEAKNGTPPTLYVEIWSDSGGDPDAVITNGSASLAEASVIADEYNWFTFSTPPELTANTLYWVVARSASASEADYYKLWAFDGEPGNGDGVWGDTTEGHQLTASWGSTVPPFTIIKGYIT